MSDEETRVLLDTSAGSPEIREAVLRMREAGEAGETRTPSGSTYDENGKAFARAASASAGTLIGRYLLMEKLGEGGMGEVWLAEQQEPVRRRVALKLIRAGMNSREVIRRFESERQTLALMDHPGIARVFDAGSTPEGIPYFVMEYASGEPMTGYCDRRQLSTRQRLELFRQLCEAVQHAHQKAIIHRDLKPSNILVTEVDGRPMPKIIDFGIAKALGQNLTGETLVTRMGALIGTPEYASPEQALSSGEDIDTRTDIYSLGVVFYELLAGVRPIELSNIPLAEFLKRLREDDPPKPSTRVTTQDPATSGEVARKRQTEPVTLAKLLNGDLDAIALKALEKDRSRRYSTPMEFAVDIERYLHNQPVLACAPSASYRIGKYVSRHRFAVSAAATAVALLIGFAIAQAAQLRRITRERDRADRVTEFMTSMFKVSDPSEARGNEIRAREILDKASKNIDNELTKDPELQAQMMHVMGNVYESLGLYSNAWALLTKAVEIRRRVLGLKDASTLSSMHDLAVVMNDESRYPEAEKLARETLDARRSELGSEHRNTLESMNQLALILDNEGRFADAEKLHRQVANTTKRVLGPEDQIVRRRAMHDLAIDLAYEGKFPESEQVFREVLDSDRRDLGPDHPDVLGDMGNLAATLQHEEKWAEAEKLYLETLPGSRRVRGPEHPHTLLLLGNLALVLLNEKRYPEAEKLFRETHEIKRRVLGPEHRSTLVTEGNLADTLRIEGRYPEAERLFREMLDAMRRTLGPSHSDYLVNLYAFGTTLQGEKRFPEAERVLRDALEAQRHVLGDAHPDTADSAYTLAEVLAAQGKQQDALNNLQFAVEHGLRSDVRSGLGEDEAFKSMHGNPRFEALLAKK
jgi:serine/threonine protein kinase